MESQSKINLNCGKMQCIWFDAMIFYRTPLLKRRWLVLNALIFSWFAKHRVLKSGIGLPELFNTIKFCQKYSNHYLSDNFNSLYAFHFIAPYQEKYAGYSKPFIERNKKEAWSSYLWKIYFALNWCYSVIKLQITHAKSRHSIIICKTI